MWGQPVWPSMNAENLARGRRQGRVSGEASLDARRPLGRGRIRCRGLGCSPREIRIPHTPCSDSAAMSSDGFRPSGQSLLLHTIELNGGLVEP